MEPSLIRIQANAAVQARPDRVLISFGIREDRKEYNGCLDGLATRVHHLRAAVMEAGLRPDDLMTTQFQVEPRYDYVDGRQVFRGFEARQDIQIRFSWDKERLSLMLGLLSRSESRAEFSVHFEVTEEEPMVKEALALAFRQALGRATVLAQASGRELGEVLMMEYVARNIPVAGPEVRMMAAASAPSLVIDPALLKVEAILTVAWALLPASPAKLTPG